RTDAGHDLALGQMPMAHQPRQSAVSLSAWPPRKPAISASTACANSARAPLRKISVNGSLKVAGCASLITLSWVTAYHSFGGEVEAFEHPTIRRLTPSSRHQLSRIAQLGNKRPEHFVDKLSLAALLASLEYAARLLEQKRE